jgi:hypothetical protein
LFSIDAITGNVISKPQFPTPNIMGYFAFDNSSGIIYGIRLSSAPLSSVFVSIDPVNSNYTIIDTIPYDLSGGISMGNTSFDELNKRYTFSAMDNNNNLYLYTIDATNGQIISNPSFPVFVAPYNLIETKYDNSSGNLYALHWGQNSELTTGIEGPNQNSEVIIFPNPSSGKFVVQCANVKIQSLKMYNMLGELVYSTTQLNLVIDLSSQPNGVYFIHIISERGRAVKKVVINK